MTAASEETLHQQFLERKRILLNHVVTLTWVENDPFRKRMWYSMARLGLGVELDKAIADITFVNDDMRSDDMFFRHSNIDAFLRFGHLYPEKLTKAVIQRLQKPYEIHHGHTENHRIMIAVAGYLAAQTWPQWEGSAATLVAMDRYLSQFFDRVSRFGQGEFDSTTYSVLYLITLASLFDFATDELMRQKARMMLEWFLANAASEWLNGYFIGGHSRDVHPIEGPEFATAGGTAMWLYFGGRQPDLNSGEPHYAVLSAITSFRMPTMLARISLDRSSYEHRETHELLKIDGETHDLVMTKPVDAVSKGYGYVSQVGVRKYSWRTANYAMSSFWDGKSGEMNFWAAVRRWSVDWDSDRPGSTLFFTHPFPPPNASSDAWYQGWQGSSPFEQIVQHRDALVALYNVPTDGTYFHPFSKTSQPSNTNPFIEGFISGTAILRKVEDPSGWIFADGGSVLIAMRPLLPYRWLENGRLRSDGAKNGVVIETDDPRDFAGSDALSAFAKSILAKTKIQATLDAAVPSVSYTSRSGEELKIVYDGPRSVNGKAIDYGAWPLIANPFMQSTVNSAKLELHYGRDVRALDFVNWTTADSVTSLPRS